MCDIYIYARPVVGSQFIKDHFSTGSSGKRKRKEGKCIARFLLSPILLKRHLNISAWGGTERLYLQGSEKGGKQRLDGLN